MLNRQNKLDKRELHYTKNHYNLTKVFSICTEILVRELQQPRLTQNSLNQL